MREFKKYAKHLTPITCTEAMEELYVEVIRRLQEYPELIKSGELAKTEAQKKTMRMLKAYQIFFTALYELEQKQIDPQK